MMVMSRQLNQINGVAHLGGPESPFRVRITLPLALEQGWTITFINFQMGLKFDRNLSFEEAFAHPALAQALSTCNNEEDQVAEIGDCLLQGFSGQFPWKCDFKYVGKFTPGANGESIQGFSSFDKNTAFNLMLRLTNTTVRSSGWFLLEYAVGPTQEDFLEEQLIVARKAQQLEKDERDRSESGIKRKLSEIGDAFLAHKQDSQVRDGLYNQQLTQLHSTIQNVSQNVEKVSGTLTTTINENNTQHQQVEENIDGLRKELDSSARTINAKIEVLSQLITKNKIWTDDSLAQLLSTLTVEISKQLDPLEMRLTQFIAEQDQPYNDQFKKSTLLSDDFKRLLVNWTSPILGNGKWELLWRTGHNASNLASSFHTACDNKGPTITVIKSNNGMILGGFTTRSWTSNTSYYADTHAFIFTLKNPHNIPPTKFVTSDGASAVYHNPSFGPTFGGGHDIYVANNSAVNVNPSATFCIPHRVKSTVPANLFVGSNTGTVQEMEIFHFSC